MTAIKAVETAHNTVEMAQATGLVQDMDMDQRLFFPPRDTIATMLMEVGGIRSAERYARTVLAFGRISDDPEQRPIDDLCLTEWRDIVQDFDRLRQEQAEQRAVPDRQSLCEFLFELAEFAATTEGGEAFARQGEDEPDQAFLGRLALQLAPLVTDPEVAAAGLDPEVREWIVAANNARPKRTIPTPDGFDDPIEPVPVIAEPRKGWTPDQVQRQRDVWAGKITASEANAQEAGADIQAPLPSPSLSEQPQSKPGRGRPRTTGELLTAGSLSRRLKSYGKRVKARNKGVNATVYTVVSWEKGQEWTHSPELDLTGVNAWVADYEARHPISDGQGNFHLPLLTAPTAEVAAAEVVPETIEVTAAEFSEGPKAADFVEQEYKEPEPQRSGPRSQYGKMLRDVLEAGPKVLQRVIKQADEGCIISQKMVLDRAFPVRRAGIKLDLTLDGADFVGDFNQGAIALARQMSRGDVAPGEAAEAMTVLAQATRTVRLEEAMTQADERLTAIEGKTNGAVGKH